MGGVLILVSIVVPSLLWANLRNPYLWVALFGALSFGAIGFWDDYLKLRRQKNLGLTGRKKFLLQVVAALLIGLCLLGLHAVGFVFDHHECPVLQAVEAVDAGGLAGWQRLSRIPWPSSSSSGSWSSSSSAAPMPST